MNHARPLAFIIDWTDITTPKIVIPNTYDQTVVDRLKSMKKRNVRNCGARAAMDPGWCTMRAIPYGNTQ